jgi:hypothetical protein
VPHAFEDPGDKKCDQRQERDTHQGHDQALGNDFRAFLRLARTQVLGGHRIGVAQQPDEETKREE